MDFNYYRNGAYEPGYTAVRSLAPIKPSLSPDYSLSGTNYNHNSSFANSKPFSDSFWANPVQDTFRKNSRMSGVVGFNGTAAPKSAASKELPPIKKLVIHDFRRAS